MSSGKVGDPVIHAETGAPAGATYILHPPRSFGARLGRFFSRLFVLSFVAVAGFGGGYAFNEREGLLARQDLLATISTIEKQVLQAETIREARDAHSMTIEVDMAPVMAELRLELAKVAQARVAAASGRLASALVHDGESAVDAKPGSLGKPLGFDLRELPTTHGSIRPAQELRQSAPPAIGSLRVHPDDVASTGPAATARLTVEDDVTIPQQAENSLPIC